MAFLVVVNASHAWFIHEHFRDHRRGEIRGAPVLDVRSKQREDVFCQEAQEDVGIPAEGVWRLSGAGKGVRPASSGLCVDWGPPCHDIGPLSSNCWRMAAFGSEAIFLLGATLASLGYVSLPSDSTRLYAVTILTALGIRNTTVRKIA
jgi:hypothetical protein